MAAPMLAITLIRVFRTGLLREEQVVRALGQSPQLLADCREAKWLAPKIEGPRLTLYTAMAVAKCLLRVERDGRPDPKQP